LSESSDPLEGILANAVEHHIHADAIGQFAHTLRDVFPAVIDDVVAAMRARHFALGFI